MYVCMCMLGYIPSVLCAVVAAGRVLELHALHAGLGARVRSHHGVSEVQDAADARLVGMTHTSIHTYTHTLKSF